jgi:hypothetical protein
MRMTRRENRKSGQASIHKQYDIEVATAVLEIDVYDASKVLIFGGEGDCSEQH